MGLKAKLITGGLVGLILLGLCGVIYSQYQTNTQLVKNVATLDSIAIQRQLTIQTMQANTQSQAAALHALNAQHSALRSDYSQREQTIKRLYRENQEYRNWANTHLPTSVKRLRHRPPITGSSEYREWLSSTNSLRPNTDQPRE